MGTQSARIYEINWDMQWQSYRIACTLRCWKSLKLAVFLVQVWRLFCWNALWLLLRKALRTMYVLFLVTQRIGLGCVAWQTCYIILVTNLNHPTQCSAKNDATRPWAAFMQNEEIGMLINCLVSVRPQSLHCIQLHGNFVYAIKSPHSIA